MIDAGARQGRNFAAERSDTSANVFEAVVAHIHALQVQRKKVTVALWSEGSRERMAHVLADHKLLNTVSVNAWRTVQATPRNEVTLAIVGMEAGFETDDVAVISEQDILGDRLVRPRRANRKLDNFISEVTSLSTGDLVVHVEHGIGRFIGLQTLDVAGAPHDCLELHYANETKLFLPVENIELLSRFGSEQAGVELDRLGGSGWQARKAKLKKRIQEIAGDLIKVAAERMLHEAPKLPVPAGTYDEFCARFPYDETEDQLTAIDATLKDLEIGPADGPPGLRRRRLWQDRSRVARGLCGRAGRQAGGRGRADDTPGAPARQNLHRALQGLSGERGAGVAPGPDEAAQ